MLISVNCNHAATLPKVLKKGHLLLLAFLYYYITQLSSKAQLESCRPSVYVYSVDV